jgi:hypothetical protein
MTGSGSLRSSSGCVPPADDDAAVVVVVPVPARDDPPSLPHAARATTVTRTSAILVRATDGYAELLVTVGGAGR